MLQSMIDLPLVSVVTPCFNGAAFLERYFRGLLSQTYQNIELVFVDDGSTDKTEAVFRTAEIVLRSRFTGPIVYIRQENKGPCAAVNTGYSASSGALLAPCDSDDVMLPNRIADHVACFCARPESQLVYGDYYMCDESEEQVAPSVMSNWDRPPEGRDVFHAMLSRGMFIKCGSYCFRRSCLSLLPEGRLNESDPGQNLDLLLRVGYHGRIAFHPTPVVKIIQRGDSLTRKRSLNALRHVFRSKEIVNRVIRDLKCSDEVWRRVEKRYLPNELRYYLVTGNARKLRARCWQAFRLGLTNRFTIEAFVASYSARLRDRLIRKKFSEFQDCFTETDSALNSSHVFID